MAIASAAAGPWAAANAATQTLTLPAHAAGNLILVVAAAKLPTPGSADVTITTQGWERLAAFNDGSVASANNTGSVWQAVFFKYATSAAETNPVLAFGGSQVAAPSIAVGLVFSKATTEEWVQPIVLQKALNVATSISVTMNATPSLVAGDMGVVAFTTSDDSALTVPTWTATGLSLGTAGVLAVPIASGTSNDMAGTAAYRLVASGTPSVAPTLTATQAAAENGVCCFVQLRVGPPRVPFFRPYTQIVAH